MKPDRWQQVEDLCHAALARPAGDRAAFLTTACAGDEVLQREVESLLAQESSAAAFMSVPAAAVAGSTVLDHARGTLVGQRLGSYTIRSLLGVGGMGEVYRAHDDTLGREVAIKVLPPAFTADPERRARFEREARLLAALNHPHIGALYGVEETDGVRGLVMELVEGPTLADRIAQGAIPVDEALPIAKQIAEALEAAHEQGIIHRDLKPANVKVRPDGVVKVLDFGLAKALDSAPAAIDSSHLPPITSPALMTGVGVLLGTAAYAAPEQAVGKPADKGSDLWAFGVILMEMLTGHPVFAGETVTHVLAAVLKSDPDWTRLPRATSPAIRRLLRRCLEKGRRKRLDSAGAARLEIDEALAADDARADTSTWLTPSRRAALIGAGMFVLGTLASGVVAWMVRAAPATGMVSRFPVPLEEAATMLASNAGSNLALSPDGATLVYTAIRSSGTSQLFRRDLSSLDAVPIPGTEGASFPVFSPDGQSLAFVRGSDVLTMPVAGGATTRVYRATLPNKNPTQLSWGSTGMIVFGFTGNGDGVMQVPASGGTATRLTALDTAAGETDHRQPEMLPGGEAILFTAWSGPAVTEGLESAEIVAYTGSTGERRRIIAGAGAQFVDSGHLIFVRPDGLWAVPFSSSRLETTGMPVRVLEGVLTFNTGVPQLAVASNGTLVYQPGRLEVSGSMRTVLWVTRDGTEEDVGAPSRPYVYARLSPDGTQIALDERGEQNDIWVWNARRRNLMRLTFDPGENISPVWTPDGTRIAFGGELSDGGPGLFWTRADGAGTVERLTSERALPTPTAFTPDGGRLLFHSVNNPRDIAVVTLTGRRNGESLLQTASEEANAEVSPDGKWLAYQSDESGSSEIYVRPFPNITAGRWQVSSDGGSRPMWARNGRALFYTTTPLLTLMEVPIEPGTSFVAGTPRIVLKGPNRYVAPQYGRPYDVTADGQRFLMLRTDAVPPAAGGSTSQQLILVHNWFEELKRLVPN